MVTLGIIQGKEDYSYELAVKNMDSIQKYGQVSDKGYNIEYNSDKGIIIIDKDELISN
ncbi:MAG: hypothetical protein U0V74_02730 [Chitinophagales bacterium]